jgi:DNA polymerase elongation subunit (family B)
MGFYTSVAVHGNKILYRGFRRGERVQESVDYYPTLFVPAKKESKFQTLDGKMVEPFRPGTMRDCRDFIENYGNVSGFRVYGNTDYIYQFIGDLFSDEVEYNSSNIRVAFLDIETTCEHGFPNVENPIEELIAITLKVGDVSHVFGLGKFDIDIEGVVCHVYDDEATLLYDFIQIWRKLDPDIVTGWNVKFFDIAYLYSRMKMVLGETAAKKLSPWDIVRDRKVQTKHGVQQSYDILGVATLDYLDLYKTFTYVNQESYKLDHIAFVELGEKKISYDEYDSIADFYRNDFQKFVEYNYQDTILIEKLENKMKLLELALALAYNAKVNYVDVFSQVRTWDQIIYHHLRKKNIVIPMKKAGQKESQIIGAYVKEPIVGKHDWVVSFDLNSLYPHLIMQYNISPETKINVDDNLRFGVGPNRILSGECKDRLDKLKTIGSVAANGTCYRKNFEGFLPELMRTMYEERKKYKKLMIEAEKNGGDPYEIAKYHNFQLVRKIQLNSAYGAIANQYFRYYDTDMAEAITCSGQLAIQWIANALNVFLNKHLETNDVDYVVASDTDSVYLRLGGLVNRVLGNKYDVQKAVDFLDKACEEVIQPFIDKEYQKLSDLTGAYANKMQMAREVIADKGIWTAKKRYMLNVYDSEGVRYNSPKLKIMGIETTRSSTPHVVRDKLKEAIKIIMTGTEDQLIGFVSEFRTQFMKLTVDDVAFPRGCNNLNTYRDPVTIWKKSTPIAVKGALVYNHFVKEWNLTNKYVSIQEGDKVKFINLKKENPFGCNVISFPGVVPKEFELEKYTDYRKQFETAFIDPLSTILSHIGWHHERRATLFI